MEDGVFDVLLREVFEVHGSTVQRSTVRSHGHVPTVGVPYDRFGDLGKDVVRTNTKYNCAVTQHWTSESRQSSMTSVEWFRNGTENSLCVI